MRRAKISIKEDAFGGGCSVKVVGSSYKLMDMLINTLAELMRNTFEDEEDLTSAYLAGVKGLGKVLRWLCATLDRAGYGR